MEDGPKKWEIDKRVPLALIVALAVQTAAVLIWGAKMDQRVTYLERSMSIVDPYGERLARIEVLVEQVSRRQEADRLK